MYALLCATNRYIYCRYVYDVSEDANGIDGLVPFRLTVNGESGKPEVQGFKKGYQRPLKYPWVKDCQRIEISVSDSTWRTLLLKVMGNIWPWRQDKACEQVLVLGRLAAWTGVEDIVCVQRWPHYTICRVAPVYVYIPGNVMGSTKEKSNTW